MCVGQQGGAEAAVHAMVAIFGEESCHSLIQVHSENAFNSLNRKVLFKNIFVSYPVIGNCYIMQARLFVTGGGDLKSVEGTTQGGPIATPIYAIGLDPLINKLRGCDDVKQSGFADDLSGAGTIDSLKIWWDKIIELGPKIGYFAKPSKSWLIVKPHFFEQAKEVLKNSGLQITTQGRRHLGAVVGSEEFKKEFVTEKVAKWIDELTKLTKIAQTEPHVAYAAYTHGFKQIHVCNENDP